MPPRVAIGLTTLALTGLADDQLGNVPITARLTLQVASGCLFSSTPLALPAASFLAAGVVNVFNFMDGINGISGTTAVVWGASVNVEDAYRVRLHLTDVSLPEGTELWEYSSTSTSPRRPSFTPASSRPRSSVFGRRPVAKKT